MARQMSWTKQTIDVQAEAHLERASPCATGIDLDDVNMLQAATVLLGTVLQWWLAGGWFPDEGRQPSAPECLHRCFQRVSSGGNGWHGTIPLPTSFGPLTPLKIALLRAEAGDDGGRICRDLSRATKMPIRYCKYDVVSWRVASPSSASRWSKRIVLPDGGLKTDVLYNKKDGKLAGAWYPSGWLL